MATSHLTEKSNKKKAGQPQVFRSKKKAASQKLLQKKAGETAGIYACIEAKRSTFWPTVRFLLELLFHCRNTGQFFAFKILEHGTASG